MYSVGQKKIFSHYFELCVKFTSRLCIIFLFIVAPRFHCCCCCCLYVLFRHEKPVILKAKGEIRYKSVEEYIVFRTLAFSYKIKSDTAAKIELFEKGKWGIIAHMKCLYVNALHIKDEHKKLKKKKKKKK